MQQMNKVFSWLKLDCLPNLLALKITAFNRPYDHSDLADVF